MQYRVFPGIAAYFQIEVSAIVPRRVRVVLVGCLDCGREEGVVAEDALTEREFAEQVSRSLPTVRTWRHTGYGPPSYKIGSTVYYEKAHVDAWLQQQRQAGVVRAAGRAATRGATAAIRRPAREA